MDLASALTTQGILEKQSPGVFKIYQTRYFAIRGKGDFLVWYKKKPINPDQNPKGIINIQTITQVTPSEQDTRQFSITYLQRTFNLRAESSAVQQRWVNSLKAIMNHHKKLNKNKVKQQEQTAQSWKWKNNQNKQISEKIRLQNEQVILQDHDNSKGKLSELFLSNILKDKNIADIEKCIVFGFFTKKKLIGSSNRWFFLASGVNLKDQKDQQLYPATQQLLLSLQQPEKQQKKQQPAPKSKYDDSSSDEQQSQMTKKKQQKKQKLKMLRTNTLFQYDPQTKQIKYIYPLVDVVSFQMKTSQQPFQLKIVYQQVVNEQEQQIKQQQIVLVSQFLIQVKKLYTAIKIINQKYNMQKQRQEKNANKSKRYPAKKWKYVNEDQWRIPDQKASLYVLLNKRVMRINMLTISLQEITSHNKESLTVSGTGNQEDQKFSKKQDALLVVYKKQNQQFKIYIQFDKMQTMVKFMKKLSKNIKKQQQQLQAQNAAKITNRKQQQKKMNPQTYLIDKRIRETHTSIKVNFYELMDREVIVQKKQDNGNQNKGLWAKFMGMFCANPPNIDLG